MELSKLDPALQAVCLLAVDPQGVGGLCLRSAAGPALRTVVPGQPRATADGPMVEILSGLVAGDRVVTDPAPTTGAGADHE